MECILLRLASFIKHYHLETYSHRCDIHSSIHLVVCSVAKLRLTLCDPTDSSTPGFPVPRLLLEFAQVHVHLNLCWPLLLLPSIFPSIKVFSNEFVVHIRWPKYWSFSFSISLPNEYSGLISFRIDWFNIPAVQGTLKSLLQHHN